MRGLRLAVPVVALALLALALTTGCGGDDGPSSTAEGCESVDQPSPREPEALDPPSEGLDPATTYTLTFETNCGTFSVELDAETAPKTSASLVSLARAGYFDDTIFHRIVPGYVIQGGDPTQTRLGGPGYTTVDVPPAGFKYTKGTVAMAKSSVEPRGTSGSQFFVVTVADSGLEPDYAAVGTVSEGMDVVERIGALGDETEQPTQPIVISQVEVSES